MKPTWPRCPKCKSQNVELIEIWTASISWIPDDPYANEGALMPGDPFKVEGHCQQCGFRWRIRGTIQVQPSWFKEK